MSRKRINSDSSEESNSPGSSSDKKRRSGRSKIFKVTKNERGESKLHVNCIRGNLKTVEVLLREGHPVNVTDFNGWTPLHEAANHGFVTICERLIEYKANVNAVGPDGLTPLLDSATNGLVDVMKLLLNNGASVTATTNDHEDVIHLLDAHVAQNPEKFDTEDILEVTSLRTDILMRMRKKMFPHTDKPFLVEEAERIESNRRNSRHRVNLDAAETSKSNDGATVYQKAIRNVRDSAIHRTIKSSKDKPKAPALIPENATVAADDDFIENDLLPRSSRKRPIDTDPLNRRAKQLIRSRRYDDSSEDESDNEGSERSHSSSVGGNLQSFAELLDSETNHVTDATNDVVEWPSGDSLITDSTPTSTGSARISVRPETFRQLNRLNSDRSTVSRQSDTESGRMSGPEEPLSSTVAPVSRTPGGNFRIRVKTQDGPILLIPITPESSIKDLVDLVIKRRYSKELRTPVVKLMLDGAELCDEDIVSVMLQCNDTVSAELHGWATLDAADSYKKLCGSKKIDLYEDVVQRLTLSTESLRLDVADFALRGVFCESLLDSLCLSSRLTEINFSGNRLSGMGSRLWCLLRATSSVLQRLNLSNTSLDKEDLQCLVITMKNEKPAETVLLTGLLELDLSHNNLEDESGESLRWWFNRCPSLQTLQLICINITGGFFGDIPAKNPVAGLHSLVSLSVSDNRLNQLGIHSLLSVVPEKQLKVLDLSKTYEDSLTQPSILSELVLFALRESNRPSGLSEINLSATGLTLNNLEEFMNGFHRWFPTLRRLNLSRNPSLGNVGLAITLKSLINLPLAEVLDFRCCAVAAPLELEVFDQLGEKMTSVGSKLRSFQLSFTPSSPLEAIREDVDRICECFTESWKRPPRVDSLTTFDYSFVV